MPVYDTTLEDAAMPLVMTGALALPGTLNRPEASPSGLADEQLGDPPCLPAPLMIGVALPGGVCGGHEPELHYSTPDTFARVKKSRKELHALLQRLAQQPYFREGFIWDTCQRIEFYGWVRGPDSRARREAAAARITHELFGAPRLGLPVNRLEGCHVWHHLMRTACGLNSRLPGDLDVTAQLETAVHFAQSAGVAGGRVAAMIERVRRVTEGVGRATEWGRFRTGYCRAALRQLWEPERVSWDRRTHVVIGGSTTSRSIINTLVNLYDVPQPRITLVYRGHHGQWKLLRDALGEGRRVRVQSYADPEIARAVAAADVVFFGLDVAGAVLSQAAIDRLRNYRRQPLLLVDFNSFGSVEWRDTVPGVTLCGAPQLDAAVTSHAELLRQRPDFCRAAHAADRWIRSRGLAGVARPTTGLAAI